MMLCNHTQRIIENEMQIPQGYVQMITYGAEISGRLSQAAKRGVIPSVKIMQHPQNIKGPVYLDKTATDHYLKTITRRGPYEGSKRTEPSRPRTEPTTERSENQQILRLLERQNHMLTAIASDLGYSF